MTKPSDKAFGSGGQVPGHSGESPVRDLASLMGYLPAKITDENVTQVVRALVELLQGPVASEILVMGRYINEQGEVGRLSRPLMNRLEDTLSISGTDSDAIHDNVASEISAITEKASPVSADLLIIEDSADSNNKKRVQITNLPAGSEVNDLSAAVTWANVPNANITEASVTQHEGAIDHDALTNFAAGEHRVINDAGTSATELWSASKIDGELHDAVTVAGTPDYITLSGQVLTRNDVDLANDVTGNLPVGNLNSGTGATSSTFWRGDGTWVAPTASVDLKPYCATGSGVNLTTTEATMDLSTEQVTDANYSLATDQITVTDAGTYQISYGVQVLEDGTGGAARSATTFHMEIGTTPITQSEMSCYNRETSGPSGASTTFIVVLSASDVLQLRGFVDYTATTDVSQGVTSVSIIKLE